MTALAIIALSILAAILVGLAERIILDAGEPR